ncbi:MAG: hypothetical protein ACI83W_000783 [Marinoscillum sp.]|jgi:hypothetical protein
MAKKITLNLTLSAGQLWWSSDGGINWAIAGPKSPTTLLNKDYELQWICDDATIDDLEITIDSGTVLEPATGTKKEKTSKVNPSSKNGDLGKYSIIINGAITIDPDVKVCSNPPCGVN